jgi:hypothetical protein
MGKSSERISLGISDRKSSVISNRISLGAESKTMDSTGGADSFSFQTEALFLEVSKSGTNSSGFLISLNFD